ncbi:MAG: 30S ribosomal protein S6 [Fidelibacterota bacterium]
MNTYYETLFIVDPTLEQENVTKIVNDVKEYVKRNGGEIVNSESWGKRKLAYQIEKHKYGHYILLQYSSPGSLIHRLEERFELNEKILSYMTVRLKKKPEMVKEEERKEQ